MRLFEQYRPKTWEDVVGQAKALAKIDVLRRRGLAGRAFWLSGPSGVGKTSIAKLLAGEVADPFYVTEIDATDLTPARLRELEYQSHLGAPGKGGRAFIVNESHGLRRDAVRQLLVGLERIPGHVVWIFTTTTEGLTLFEEMDDSSPLLSRCTELALTSQGLAKPGAKRLREIAQAEGLDGQPIEKYVRLMGDCKNNLRRALQKIEEGAMIA